jgi:hypothetical protein
MKPLGLRSYGKEGLKLGLTYPSDLNHIKILFLVQPNLNSRIIDQAFMGISRETMKLPI